MDTDMVKQTKFKSFINANFHALTHKNYRMYIISFAISLIGTWMQNITQSWIALQITNSPFLLSLISVMQMLPLFLLSLFAGVICDVFSKKKIMIICQSVLMVQALLLSILTLTGNMKYSLLLISAFVVGICNAFDFAARQSFAMEIVGREDLPNAVALNSATFNLARLIGPMIASSVMLLVGGGWCFFINALTFIPFIVTLFFMKVDYVKPEKISINFKFILKSVVDGLKFMKEKKILVYAATCAFVFFTLTFNFNVLLPVLAKIKLGGNENTFGMFMSAMGVGALGGAFLSSVLANRHGIKMKSIILANAATAIIMIVTAFSNSFIILLILTAVQGTFIIMISTGVNSILQLNSTNENRGRIMSIFGLLNGASGPLGSVISGGLSDKVGVSNTYLILGISTLVGGFLITLFFKNYKKSKYK